MNTDDVQAAAERIRRWRDGEKDVYYLSDDEFDDDAIVRDRDTIFAAHLALAPVLAELWERLAILTEAALNYDAAIQRHAIKGESWTGGDDLDDLYATWTEAATKAKETLLAHPLADLRRLTGGGT